MTRLVFFRTPVKKSDARRFGPAQVLFIQDSQAFVLYAGRVAHVPLHCLKVYNPDDPNFRVPECGEPTSGGVLAPPAFRDVITMDPSFASTPSVKMEASPVGEVKMESMEPSEVEPPVAQGKDHLCADSVPQLPSIGGLTEPQDDMSSISEISSLNDTPCPRPTESPTAGLQEYLSGLK